MSMLDNDKNLRTLLRGQYGIQEKNPQKRSWFKRVAIVSLVLGLLTLNLPLLFIALVAFLIGITLWPLTDKGLSIARYLDGLKQYIKIAEVDRLKALQSPEGALKIGKVNTSDPSQVVKLYEQVLPYAVLFGLEKEWNKRIGEYYESIGSSPSWYTGQSAFSAAAFTSGISSFSTAASYTSAGSSSSGGSSGGGSSGGGGGGGGGGGW